MASADYSVLDRSHDETSSVLASLGLSSATRGTGGAPLTIPLDAPLPIRKKAPRVAMPATTGIASFGPDRDVLDTFNDGDVPQTTTARRLPVTRRKEGSRQRRRWENDRLLHVPNVQPPLPSDWEVRPTHPVHNHVPYHIAHVWDAGLRRRVNETRAAAAVLRRQQFVARQAGTAGPDPDATAVPALGLVTRELRTAAKKVPAVRTWVRVLEEPIRDFALRAAAAAAAEPEKKGEEAKASEDDPAADSDGTDDTEDTTDTTDTTDYAHARAAVAAAPPSVSCFSGDEDDGEDELVFVGRRPVKTTTTTTSGMSLSNHHAGAGIVLGTLPGADRGDGSFQRWLIHSVSEYYGLVSQSATLGMPPRRAVYVTQRDEAAPPGCGPAAVVPRPMWELFCV